MTTPTISPTFTSLSLAQWSARQDPNAGPVVEVMPGAFVYATLKEA